MVTVLKKITFLLLASVFVISSCTNEKPVVRTNHVIENNMNFQIGIKTWLNETVIDTFFLNKGESKKFQYDETAAIGGIPFMTDSLIVTFDDTISITHYPWNLGNENVKRSILLTDSWEGGKIDDNEYYYEYIFTEADYQEALEVNGY